MTVSDMTTTMMTMDDFEMRALAYGGDVGCWPEEDRAPARALADASPEAKAMLREARALDETLDLWEAPQPSEDLLARVLADAGTVAGEMRAAAPSPARPAPRPAGWAVRLFGGIGVRRSAFALAACLTLGFVMGTTMEREVLAPAPPPVETTAAPAVSVIDFAFAMEDDADLLLGDGTLL